MPSARFLLVAKPRKGVVPPQLRPYLFRKKGGRSKSGSSRGSSGRTGMAKKGSRRRNSIFSMGRGTVGKLTRPQTLGSGAVGAVSTFLPPAMQPTTMMVGGALVGSDALLDMGAYATGRQLAKLLPQVQFGSEGGVNLG